VSVLRAPRERRAIDASTFNVGELAESRRSWSGENVTPDKAMRLSAVWACVRVLADVVSTMPIDVFRGQGPTRVEVLPKPQVVANPSLRVGAIEWKYQGMVSALLRGNAYGAVQGEAHGYPTTVEWINPDMVIVTQPRPFDPLEYTVGGVKQPSGSILHFRARTLPGSPIGLSPIDYHRQAIGVGLAAQKFGAQWFGDGAHPSAVLESDQRIDEDTAKTIKARFLAAVKGRREPAVLGAGVKYQQIQVSADESQFLSTMRMTVEEICRIFGVPPEMIAGAVEGKGSHISYANEEQRNLEFLKIGLVPWLARWEEFLTGILPRPQYVKFNPASLLRADTKTRFETHAIALENHFETIDEVRDLEDRAPLANGEEFPPLKTPGPAPAGKAMVVARDHVGRVTSIGPAGNGAG
jgi:HK97 family phage portal protein